MAQYDDWVYERGLENEDWVHDRWGDDDWDDDYDGYQDKGEDEDMEQIGNRISFVKGYTDSEILAIDTKINRILKEFADMEIGPCAFRLNDEIMCIYCVNSFGYGSGKDTMGFTFKYRDYDENKSESKNGHYDTYSAKSLFITKYESEIKQELLEARKTFDESEKSVFDITYTREDGIETILKAYENGAANIDFNFEREDGFNNIFKAIELGVNIDIDSFLELPDLTNDEIKILLKNGYGYDLYFNKNISYDLKEIVRNKFHIYGHSSMEREAEEKLNAWVKENPEKCLLPENRHPERTEDIQEEEEKEM